MFRRFTKRTDDKKFKSMVSFFGKIVNMKQGSTYENKNDLSPINTDFDIFYLCLIFGIKYNYKEDYKKNFVNKPKDIFLNQSFFPDNYRIDNNTDKIVIPILLSIIAKENKIDLTNKDKVRELIREYITPDKLSPKLITILNDYSAGGYMKILEKFNYEIPTDVSQFFVSYNKYLME